MPVGVAPSCAQEASWLEVLGCGSDRKVSTVRRGCPWWTSGPEGGRAFERALQKALAQNGGAVFDATMNRMLKRLMMCGLLLLGFVPGRSLGARPYAKTYHEWHMECGRAWVRITESDRLEDGMFQQKVVPGPVSYTHLDVYKRQCLRREEPVCRR